MSPSRKLIYYYQSFSELSVLRQQQFKNLYLYISSLHFGTDISNKPYLHLNDSTPQSQYQLWKDIEITSQQGAHILVMLGGAGGAYATLFQDFETYYSLLYKFLKQYTYIEGIDLDVEEYVGLEPIQKLITRIRNDFGKEFIITMAPVAYSMTSDGDGMGGFCYKDLYHSHQGSSINWFNVQCYGCYDYETYQQIIKNGYPSGKIVMGMLGDNYDPSNFPDALTQLEKVLKSYPTMGGSVLWEYGDTTISPITWGIQINLLFSQNTHDKLSVFWVCLFYQWLTFFVILYKFQAPFRMI